MPVSPRVLVLSALLLSSCGGGGGGGGPALTLTPAILTLAYGQGSPPEVTLTAELNRSAATVHVQVVDGAGLLAGAPTIAQTGATTYLIGLEISPAVPEGHYTDQFEVRLCPDPACTTQLPGSPVTLPYDITVGDATVSSLLPYVDDEGIKLFDPRFPRNATNPRQVDTPLTGGVLDYNLPKVLMMADWDGSGFMDLRPDRLVYVKGGVVFGVNLQASQASTPVRISSINTACRVVHVYNDYQDVNNSRLLVRVRTGNNTCGSHEPNGLVMVSATATALTGGTALPPGFATDRIEPLNAADGSLVGFLNWESPTVVRRDATFANPQAVLVAHDTGDTGYPGYSRSRGNFTDSRYFVSRADGSTEATVYRYSVGAGTLTPLMPYVLVGGIETYAPYELVGAVDAENLYFTIGVHLGTGGLYRVAHDSTTPVLMSDNPFPWTPRYASLTDSHVVFAGFGNDGIYSLPKTAENADPILIPGNGQIVNADPDGMLLIQDRDFGVFPSEPIARVAMEDGTAVQTFPGRRWTGRMMEGAWNPLAETATRILLVDGAASRLYDAPSATEIADLGTLLPANPDLSFGMRGFGRYLSLDADMVRTNPTGVDRDGFFIDTEAGTPPLPVLDTRDIDAVAAITDVSTGAP
jgi:hypothetical protein